MQGNSKKKFGAIMAAAVAAVFMLVFIGTFILLMNGEETAGGNCTLAICIGVFMAMIIGVAVSLKQRFGEIESGEEDEARKY